MNILIDLLLRPRAVWDGLLWLSLPALLQWFILRATRDRFRALRLALPAVAGVMGCALLSALLLFLAAAAAILFLISLLLQESFMGMFLELFQDIFVNGLAPTALFRLALLLAGWRLGWMAYTHTRPEGGEEYV